MKRPSSATQAPPAELLGALREDLLSNQVSTEVVSVEALAMLPDEPTKASEAEADQTARRERARAAAVERRERLALASKMKRLADLYRRWHLGDAARRGPDELKAERALLIRTPVPAVIETTANGDKVFLQYARGTDTLPCSYCKGPCPKDGKKFLVVMSPWGIWCPSCAHKGAAMIGEPGMKQRMAERRRQQARSSSRLKSGGDVAR